jgi:hypothetical protein
MSGATDSLSRRLVSAFDRTGDVIGFFDRIGAIVAKMLLAIPDSALRVAGARGSRAALRPFAFPGGAVIRSTAPLD